MFGKKKTSHGNWFKNMILGGAIASIFTFLFAPRNGRQMRKKINGIKNVSNKKGKTLLKNSKNHAKTFLNDAKSLTKNISKEIKEFTKAIIKENKEK